MQGKAHVNPARYVKNISELNELVGLSGKRVLEVGSGFGISLALMCPEFGADAYAIEPGSEGFSSSFAAAREILKANDIDPTRVVDAVGEHIPQTDVVAQSAGPIVKFLYRLNWCNWIGRFLVGHAGPLSLGRGRSEAGVARQSDRP